MIISPALGLARTLLLSGDDGFVLVAGAEIVGHIGYRLVQGEFYVHSLRVWESFAARTVEMVFKVLSVARGLGFSSVVFHVKEQDLSQDNHGCLKFLRLRRASVLRIQGDGVFIRLRI